MNCSLSNVVALIWSAIAALLGAMAAAYLWPTAAPLFVAAGLVATVSFVLIPAIKSAILDYAACRGGTKTCPLASGIDTLGQVAATISAVSFGVAGALQVTALVFLFSWFLSWLGVATEVAVVALVYSGIAACGIGVLLLLGVLSNVYGYKSCMDDQSPVAPVGPVIQ
jgi:hypothetical protein